MKDTLFSSNLRLNAKGILREFSKPVVMGILNTTPDSFYAESRVQKFDQALAKASEMIAAGASILDVGGYSSRPGSTSVNEAEEIARTAEIISGIKSNHPDVLVSIDTFRSGVAEKAISAGADIINDISGGIIDPVIMEVAANYSCPYIMMHMGGTPETMMENTTYENLTKTVLYYFSQQIEKALVAGIKDIIIDPGFGFSKTTEQNYELLRDLSLFQQLDKPILVGVSRKSMIYKTLNTGPEESLNGTSVLNTFSLLNGAQILRVHDVKEAAEAVQLISRLA